MDVSHLHVRQHSVTSRSTPAVIARWTVGLVWLVGVMGMQPSCADDQRSIFIRQVQYRKTPDCLVTNDPEAESISGGAVDLALGNFYSLDFLVASQLIARGSTRTSAAEPNRVEFQYAEVELQGDGVSYPRFSVNVSGIVDPTSDTNPRYGLAAVEVIPPAMAQQIRNDLQARASGQIALEARVQVFGRTLGGTDVRSEPFGFPVTACYGCMISYPSEANDTTRLGSFNCLKPRTQTAEITYCSLGTGIADCRDCQNVAACNPCVSDDGCTAISPAWKCNTSRGFCVVR